MLYFSLIKLKLGEISFNSDNCPKIANTDQEDTDGDRIGNILWYVRKSINGTTGKNEKVHFSHVTAMKFIGKKCLV